MLNFIDSSFCNETITIKDNDIKSTHTLYNVEHGVDSMKGYFLHNNKVYKIQITLTPNEAIAQHTIITQVIKVKEIGTYSDCYRIYYKSITNNRIYCKVEFRNNIDW